MPRKRQIDPGIWTNEGFVSLCHSARLLYIGLISHADDDGRIKAGALYLKCALFPADDCALDDVAGWLDSIAAARLVLLNEADGEPYAALPTWHKHQYITKRLPSKIPAPVRERCGSGAGAVRERCRSGAGAVRERSAPVVVGTEVGTGTENQPTRARVREAQATDAHASVILPDEVGRFLEDKDKQRQLLTTYVTAQVTKLHHTPVRRALAELADGLSQGQSPANIVAYLRPVLKRQAAVWKSEEAARKAQELEDQARARERAAAVPPPPGMAQRMREKVRGRAPIDAEARRRELAEQVKELTREEKSE